MPKIRVLVVDDSAVARRRLVEIISGDDALEVCGVAKDGPSAIVAAAGCDPDVITLDVHLPGMDGLEVLFALKRAGTKALVLMVSSSTLRGASITMEALLAGASDYIAKPGPSSGYGITDRFGEQLVFKIKALGSGRRRRVVGRQGLRPGLAADEAQGQHTRCIDVVAIGVSTGGPSALAEVLGALPADFPVPILIVQHMPQMFTALLAKSLSRRCRLKVSEGQEGQVVTAGNGYLAPGGQHMVVERRGAEVRLALHAGPEVNACRPSVDVLFESVAPIYTTRALGLVMTGMGKDGLQGCAAIARAGGHILVQDEASSVVWGMPGQVMEAGLAEKALPLQEIGPEILRLVMAERY
jgi:two-component system chemotaxis response regulator CheB